MDGPLSPTESSHNPFSANFVPQAITPGSAASPSSPSRRRSSVVVKPSEDVDTCRICRGESTPTEALFYPCKCSGSIKYVHQDCLMEWLSHSQKKYCELCKTPFRFTKLYHPNMPRKLPTTVFMRKAFMHTLGRLGALTRATLVGTVWLILLPFAMRMVWRTMFWFADGGWARDRHIHQLASRLEETGISLANGSLAADQASTALSANPSMALPFSSILQPVSQTLNMSAAEPVLFSLVKKLFRLSIQPGPFKPTDNRTSAAAELISRRYDSLLSDVHIFQTLTSSPAFNRVVVDVLEGLLITLSVVVAFILVFLIREWVVQQQPIINLQVGNINNAPDAQEDAPHDAEDANEGQAENVEHPVDTGLEVVAEEHATGDAALDVQAESNIFSERRQSAEETIAQLPGSVRNAVRQGRVSEVLDIIAKLPPDEAARVKQLLTLWSRSQKEHIRNLERELRSARERLAESANQVANDTSQSAPGRIIPAWERSSVATEIQRNLEEEENASSQLQAPSLTHVQDEENVTGDGSADVGTRESVPDSWEEDMTPQEGPVQSSSKGKEKATASLEGGESPIDDRQSLSRDSETFGEPTERVEANGVPLEAGNWSVPSLASLRENDPEWRGREWRKDTPSTSETDLEPELDPEGGIAADETQVDTPPAVQETNEMRDTPHRDVSATEAHNLVDRFVQYFYGDLTTAAATADNIDTDDEHVVQDIEDEAPFVPFEDAQPALQQADQDLPPAQPLNQGQDPEVAAAAAQAGIDINEQDAIDDAEDLEGILELIGMQGPLTGLFQNALFSAVLISLTVATAVWFPYTWGKMILLFLGSPLAMWFEIPMTFISTVEGFIADVVLFFIGGVLYYSGAGLSFLYKLVMGMETSVSLEVIIEPARNIMDPAWQRLGNMTLGAQWPADADYLHASIASHAALKNIEAQLFGKLALFGNSTANIYNSGISGSPLSAARLAISFLLNDLANDIMAVVSYLSSIKINLSFWSHAAGPVVNNSTLTNAVDVAPLDPSLAFWSATDRTLAIMIGYLSFALVGCIYLSWSPPLFSEGKIRQAEQAIIDVLTQAGGVCKVILIISIEMIAFPLFCGFLLDLALLPLFENASVASRVIFAIGSPWKSGFVHWFVGTCYMFHFALFVSMCRKIMRTGVLYFIRDPDDPTFHPVRDVLERSVATQLRKIAFSAIVYGALIMLCLGGVVWSLWAAFGSVLPLHWSSSRSSIEFPLDILFYNFFTPIVVKSAKPSDGLHAMYKWWFRRCARFLRLSDFLFGERRHDEEGRHVRKSWRSWLLRFKADAKSPVNGKPSQWVNNIHPEVHFIKDGRYVRAPASDQVRIPKGEPVFVEVNENNTRKDKKPDNEGIHAADSTQTKMVYIPPWFGARISAFVVTIWFFAAVTGCGITVVPLLVGRSMVKRFSSLRSTGFDDKERVNDIYAFSLGIYTLGGLLYLALHLRPVLALSKQKLQRLYPSLWSISLLRRAVNTTTKYILRAARIVYVYGCLVGLLPLVFSTILELYVLIPLHSLAGADQTPGAETALTATAANTTVAEHTIHLVQDWTLGVLYVRIATRIVMYDRDSVLARAARAVTAEGGYLDPSAKLATRYFILPSALIFSFLLFAPLAFGVVLNSTLFRGADEGISTLLFRMQYPATAGAAMLGWLVMVLGRKMDRWRGRIRDEVYLIGERLHNFGERRSTNATASHAPGTARAGA
ncbi:hypothetical protein NA57DRAFT_51451 [Rhizodiscina lignyota]|uniref:RING-type E3 ubiquitin transferase n=1 Tax=Rhizodiscina lignyota TaxID=1504668 RepID=A0A9P4MGM0_9PEZI|nr:hypothetical protein NA57DRAFT_51451 [Rhizodiscina lignyota]